MIHSATPAVVLLAISAALAACSTRSNIAVTAVTPSQFTHVFVTTQAVWLNTGQDDHGWVKFPLKSPVTVDLVTDSNGTLGEIAQGLHLAPGSYNSILLLPVDPGLALSTSAQAVGASYNEEADFVDAAGTTYQVPLILPSQEKGIIIRSSGALKVPLGGGALPSGNNQSAAAKVTVSFGASFDGNRDLHLFNYDNNKLIGALLSADALASDLATTGGITGTLSVSSLPSQS
jgi:hypothetical protein